jgi:hypothetical protein
MTEVEVEAETTVIESDTVTVCDHCGRAIEDDAEHVEVLLGNDIEIEIADNMVHRIVQYTGSYYASERRVPSVGELDDELKIHADAYGEYTVDAHSECLAGLFDATPDSDALRLHRDRTQSDASDGDSDDSVWFFIIFVALFVPLFAAVVLDYKDGNGQVSKSLFVAGVFGSIVGTVLWVGVPLWLFGVIP